LRFGLVLLPAGAGVFSAICQIFAVFSAILPWQVRSVGQRLVVSVLAVACFWFIPGFQRGCSRFGSKSIAICGKLRQGSFLAVGRMAQTLSPTCFHNLPSSLPALVQQFRLCTLDPVHVCPGNQLNFGSAV